MVMEERFLRDQATYWHNLGFLRNDVANEIGRINCNPSNPALGDQNDTNLGGVANDDENEEVFLVNVIQLKGVAQKLEPRYKSFFQVQTLSKHEPLKKPILVFR